MRRIILGTVILCFMLVGLTGCLSELYLHDTAHDIAEENVDSINALYVTSFNNQFEIYMGVNTKGTIVMDLLDRVSSNNEEESNSKVKLVYKSLDGEEITNFNNASRIVKTKNYKVEVSKYNDSGLITEITIIEL